jgi:hypothetical protein
MLMTLAARAADHHASFMPGGKAMANDARAVREARGSVWKQCGWAAAAAGETH